MHEPRLVRLRLPVIVLVALAVVGLAAWVPASWSPPTASAATSTFSFGVAGDFGQTDSSTGAVLNAVKSSGTNMMFGIGDFSYVAGNSEPSWCSYVSSRVGATFPFELLAGNHESYPRDGYYKNYRTCLPDRLGVTGSYAQEYYVDYPAAAPLVRFVMISPNLQYDSSSATAWSYKSGTAHYTWTKNAIEGGKAKGLWVVAGMHEYCTSMVNYPCVVGADIMNLMLQEKVDLLFQAHDHAYARTKQLTVGASGCSSFPPTSYNAACVADQGATTYTKGKGTVVSTVGQGGKNMNAESPTVAQAPYFQTYEGNNQNATWGFVKVDVSPAQLSARFVRAAGGTFADAYTVTNPNPAPPTTTTTTTTSPPTTSTTTTSTTTTTTTTTTPPPPGSTTLAPVADTWVGSDATTTAHGSDTALYSVTGSPSKVTYLKFDLKALAGATLKGATLKVTTTSGAYSGSPSAQNVYPVVGHRLVGVGDDLGDGAGPRLAGPRDRAGGQCVGHDVRRDPPAVGAAAGGDGRRAGHPGGQERRRRRLLRQLEGGHDRAPAARPHHRLSAVRSTTSPAAQGARPCHALSSPAYGDASAQDTSTGVDPTSRASSARVGPGDGSGRHPVAYTARASGSTGSRHVGGAVMVR